MSARPRRIAASTAPAANARRMPMPSADGMPGHATIQSASFAQLVCSKLNVRRKGGEDLGELTALIRSQGLLQNLIGFPQTDMGEPTGFVEIVAGRRRLESIGQLIAAGDFPEDYRIPYLLISEHEAVAVSLAENSGREPMHAADVFDAMLALATRGASVIDIAASFGVDALTVKRRLKLANVAPRFLQLYRDDQISYEQMAALAVSDSHAAQEQVWDSLDRWSRQPHQLRRLLTAQQIDVRSDRVARFVGTKAFAKAGGIIDRDLFSEADAGYISDAALLERLAADKLADVAKSLEGEGHAWIAVRPRIDAGELATYAQARTAFRKPTPEEAAAMEETSDLLTGLAVTIHETEMLDEGVACVDDDNDGDDEAGNDGNSVLRRLYQQRTEAMAQRRQQELALLDIHPADKALAGALVTIDHDGELAIHRGMIRPEDKQRMETLPEASQGADGEGGKSKERAVHTERLVTLLTAHRTVALHAELMAQPNVALAVVAHALIVQVFGRGMCRRKAEDKLAKISMARPSLPDDVQSGAAWVAVQAQGSALQAPLLDVLGPRDVDDGGPDGGKEADPSLLDWLLRQPQDTILAYLAFCVGASLDLVQAREGENPGFEQLARVLQLDMTHWWQATAANYFAHVSKARITDVVTAAVSATAAVPLDPMRKVAAVDAAERIVAGSGWLPDLLKTGEGVALD